MKRREKNPKQPVGQTKTFDKQIFSLPILVYVFASVDFAQGSLRPSMERKFRVRIPKGIHKREKHYQF
jgi:hypothetical protein